MEEKMVPKIKTKVCKHCGRRKPISAFNKDRTRIDGKDFYCRRCRAAYVSKFKAMKLKNMRYSRFLSNSDFDSIKEVMNFKTRVTRASKIENVDTYYPLHSQEAAKRIKDGKSWKGIEVPTFTKDDYDSLGGENRG